ncbi:MAG TPA: hypothetical protein VJL34_00200 [Anaerolineales bacterium]|nr:hypothetical protein [Anaerolineales bacterium]
MSKKVKSKRVSGKKAPQDTPLVVYLWIVGLGLMGYLVVGEIMLGANPHPLHWVSGIVGAVVGYFVGWLWYRKRGDVF